uniref:Myosin motor domain-containing protein n=1 Tax=Anopheles albimanus TaxID=7167 RepID=A0A182FW47_ANOAL
MFNFMKKGVVGVGGSSGSGGSGNSGNSNGGTGGGTGSGSNSTALLSPSSGGGGGAGGGFAHSILGGDGGEEKDRRKKDKKARKEGGGKQLLLGVVGSSGSGHGHSGSMSAEELLRLDEVRRSLKIRGRRKEKEKLPSGITADYSASFFAQLDVDHRELDRGTEEVLAVANTTTYIDRNGEMVERVSFSSTTTTHQPPTSPYSDGGYSPDHHYHQQHQSSSSLQQHHHHHQHSTKHQTLPGAGGKTGSFPPVPPRPPKRGILKGSRPNLATDGAAAVPSSATSPSASVPNHHGLAGASAALLHLLGSPSPSADSLTDTTTTTTTNSSFATPPFSLSPVGESQGYDGRIGRVFPFDEPTGGAGGAGGSPAALPLPPLHLQPLPPPRTLTIQRQKAPRNDFGFSLRKAFVLDRSKGVPRLRAIIFAEPSSQATVQTGLLPGDRLLEVNGQPVEELSREAIIEMIRSSGEAVTVKVQPIAELIELSRRFVAERGGTASVADCSTLKRSASRRFLHKPSPLFGGALLSGEGPGGATTAGGGGPAGRVWLLHRGGFTAALRQQLSPSTVPMPSHHAQGGRVWIRLESGSTGEELLIDEDDLEVANAPAYDLVEDLCQLAHLNESSALHVLRQRYANNLIHTRAGPVLLILNPMAPLALYSEKVASMFRGCKAEDDMPPHIFSQAQTAYRAALETRRDQSIIFMGRSGAGKTTNFKHALYYLTLATAGNAGSAGSARPLTVEKVSAIGTILDAFGNERTALCGNATKFTQIFALDFDHAGQLVAGSIQVLPIDRMRPTAGGTAGSAPRWSFLAGVDVGALRKELLLEPAGGAGGALVVPPGASASTNVQQETADYQRLCAAFRTLNVDPVAVRGVWFVLAAIYHLTQSGAVLVAGRVQFVNPRAAQKAGSLLGLPIDELLGYIWPDADAANGTTGPTAGSPSGASPAKATGSSSTTTSSSGASVTEALSAFCDALYTELFYTIVGLINKSIMAATPHQTIGSVLLVDVPGFQNVASVSGGGGGGSSNGLSTLSDLRFNYLHERLQLLFHNAMLVQPRHRYAQELVTVDESLGLTDGAGGGSASSGGGGGPAPMVALLDKIPQNHEPRKGLLWMLDEEQQQQQLLHPMSDELEDDRDARFMERLFAAYGDRETRETLLLRASVPTGSCDVVLQHLLGTNPVLYSVSSWLKEAAAQAHYLPQRALNCLRDSAKPEVSGLFVGTLGGAMESSYAAWGGGGSSQQLQQQSLRRMSSIRRTTYTGGFPKRNGVVVQVKYTVDCLIDTLRRTGMHFVFCYLPQHNGGTAFATGLEAPNGTGGGGTIGHSNAGNELTRAEDDLVNIPLLRSQFRGSQMLDFARLYRLGFPISVPLGEFVIRFGLLAEGAPGGHTTGEPTTGNGGGAPAGEAATVDSILSNCEVDSSVYRIGTSLRTTSATTPATGATLNGDQLLCKCLEKGHEILRKVEELTTVVSPALRIRTVSRITSSTAAHHPPAMPAGQRKATTIPTAKAPPSGAVQSTTTVPLITPGHDGGGDDDDDDGRPETPPKIVIMAGVNSSAALTGIVGAKVTKDNTYHESDWSEDSGRMSNEHLDLLDGCSGGAGSGGSSGADTGSSSGEQEKPPRGVFFRSGVLGALEAKRDELLSDRVIQLQAHCRGYLARRRLARRRLQELAVRCIQRNVRAFLKVRDWPWWRLLVRVMPLLAVHRTEEQLVAATAELQQVRAKLEKIEAERNELKAANHKLEARCENHVSVSRQSSVTAAVVMEEESFRPTTPLLRGALESKVAKANHYHVGRRTFASFVSRRTTDQCP